MTDIIDIDGDINKVKFILKFKLAADSRGEHTLRNCPMQDLLAYHNAS
jgi:hypothetical protein